MTTTKKTPRKVALLNVHDYPRDRYSAYPEIVVHEPEKEGGPWAWQATIHSLKPLGWMHKGGIVDKHPGPKPEYPEDLPKTATGAQQEERRAQCRAIFEANPKAVHLLKTTSGSESTKDAADTAAQKWCIEHLEAYRTDKDASLHSFAGALPLGAIEAAWFDLQRELRRGTRRLLQSPMMASLIAYSTTIRSSRMTGVETGFDLGAGAALIRIYSGTRPATGGTVTTLGAELTCSDPAGSVTSGVLTFSAITADSSADNSITATWGRIVDSSATFCVDFNVGTSGSDLNLNTTTITSGVNVAISSFTLTDGSA